MSEMPKKLRRQVRHREGTRQLEIPVFDETLDLSVAQSGMRRFGHSTNLPKTDLRRGDRSISLSQSRQKINLSPFEGAPPRSALHPGNPCRCCIVRRCSSSATPASSWSLRTAARAWQRYRSSACVAVAWRDAIQCAPGCVTSRVAPMSAQLTSRPASRRYALAAASSLSRSSISSRCRRA